jgi:hypothetical protein
MRVYALHARFSISLCVRICNRMKVCVCMFVSDLLVPQRVGDGARCSACWGHCIETNDCQAIAPPPCGRHLGYRRLWAPLAIISVCPPPFCLLLLAVALHTRHHVDGVLVALPLLQLLNPLRTGTACGW